MKYQKNPMTLQKRIKRLKKMMIKTGYLKIKMNLLKKAMKAKMKDLEEEERGISCSISLLKLRNLFSRILRNINRLHKIVKMMMKKRKKEEMEAILIKLKNIP